MFLDRVGAEVGLAEAVTTGPAAAGPAADGPGAARRPVAWVHIVLGAAVVVEYFELNMVYVLLPKFYETFGDPAAVGWAVTVFSLVGAASVAVGGRLGDVLGHRTVLVAALGASAVGSFVSATAHQLGQLIVGRGIQGTAAVILPLAIGVLRTVVRTPEGQKFGTGLIAGVGYSAAGLAPLTAGLLLGVWSWPAVFVVSGSLSVLVMLLACTLPADRPGGGGWADVDAVGAVTLVPGIVLLLLGITQIAVLGVGHPLTLGGLVGGVAVLAGWVLWERRHRAPVVDLTLFRFRGFTVSCLSFALFALTLSAAIVASVLAQNPISAGGFGMSPARYGVFVLALVVVGAAMNVAGGWLTVRRGCRDTLVVGAVVQTVGFAVVALVLVLTDQRPVGLLAVLLLVAVGNGIVNTALPAFVAESVPVDRSGMAAGVQQVVKQAAQAVGQQLTAALLVAFPLVAAVAGGSARYPSLSSVVLFLALAGVVSLLIVPVALRAPAAGDRPAPR